MSLSSLQTGIFRSSSPGTVTLLRVHGEDAFGYLQSQVSADLRGKGEQLARYALWLDARGYVQADSFILAEGPESFLLFSYTTCEQDLVRIVEANIIADDVTIEPLGGGYRHWALWAAHACGSGAGDSAVVAATAGEAAPSVGGASVGAVAVAGFFADCFARLGKAGDPAARWAGATATQIDGITVPVVDDDAHTNAHAHDHANAHTDGGAASFASAAGGEGAVGELPALIFAGRNCDGVNFDLLLPAGAPEPVWLGGLAQMPWAARESRRIADGTPAVPADIGPSDMAQEGGDLIRVAVSTTKGCYLGQEVIAHWHATRQVRSGLFRVAMLAPCGEDGGDCAGAAAAVVADAADAADAVAGSAGVDRAGEAGCDQASTLPCISAAELPLRVYAGKKPVGQLRSFSTQSGAGLALLKFARLDDVRELSLQPEGPVVIRVEESVLS